MPEPQTPFRRLLEDPVYKAWLKKPPKDDRVTHGEVWVAWLKPVSHPNRPNRWYRKTFHTYKEAYVYVAKNLAGVEDAAIGCTHQEFKPPIVRTGYRIARFKRKDPKTGKEVIVKQKVPVRKFLTELPGRLPPGHTWCGYCRRPTIFGYFLKHHALPKAYCVPYEKRCRICGVRLNFLGRWSH